MGRRSRRGYDDSQTSVTESMSTVRPPRGSRKSKKKGRGSSSNLRQTPSRGSRSDLRASPSRGSRSNLRASPSRGSRSNLRASPSRGSRSNLRASPSRGSRSNLRASPSRGSRSNLRSSPSRGSRSNLRASQSRGSRSNLRSSPSRGSRSNLRASQSRGSRSNLRGSQSRASKANLSRSRGNMRSRSNMGSMASLAGEDSKVTVVVQDSRWSLTPRGKMAKYFLFGFNIVFLLSGAAILGMGTWLKLDKKTAQFQTAVHASRPNEQYINHAAHTMIALGVLIVLIAFFGCCGACAENSCLLTIYVLLLVCVYAAEITIGIIAAVFKKEAFSVVQGKVVRYFHTGKYIPGNEFARAWDTVQSSLSCCGVYNYTDYVNVTGWLDGPGRKVPSSCCVKNGTNSKFPLNLAECQAEANLTFKFDVERHFKYLQVRGCFDALLKQINKHLTYILVVVCAIVFVELMGIILACCVCFSRRRKPATETIVRELD